MRPARPPAAPHAYPAERRGLRTHTDTRTARANHPWLGARAEQCSEVRKVKRFKNGFILDPLSVSPDDTLAELDRIKHEHGFTGCPVRRRCAAAHTHRRAIRRGTP